MILEHLKNCDEIFWSNPNKIEAKKGLEAFILTKDDIVDAANRLERFAPLIQRYFPETEGGIIESPILPLEYLKPALEKEYGVKILGNFFAKGDHLLKVAGSVKARGGIYEVLKFAEEIALKNHWIHPDESYERLGDEDLRSKFSKYKIAVGSTGNLGLSIGIISATLGFQVTVHMSKDAKEWKKTLLRNKGVTVKEYDSDYGKAVEEGRKSTEGDPFTHFVDDENSKDLFLGYSVAALRLENQLIEKGIAVNKKHPLVVYLPCGVGGAPGGIAFGLKILYGDHVECYFVEPTEAPCMLLGLVTGKMELVHVEDYGIPLKTEADGLAVGRPSRMVSRFYNRVIDGGYTLKDGKMFDLLRMVYRTEGIKIEPSAASALYGPTLIKDTERTTHLAWLTGGSMIPDEEFEKMLEL